MTTATLSVGIDTSSAKRSLTELQNRIKALADTSTVDTGKLQQKIQSAVEQKAYRINIQTNANGIRDELMAYLRAAAAGPNSDGYKLHLNWQEGVGALEKRLTEGLNVKLDAGTFTVPDSTIAAINSQLARVRIPVNPGQLKKDLVEAYAGAFGEVKVEMAKAVSESLGNVNLPEVGARIGVDSDWLKKSLKLALVTMPKEYRTLLVEPSAAALKAALGTTLAAEFEVNINEASLASKVARAITTGASVGTRAISVAAGPTKVAGPQFDPVALSTALSSSLTGTLTQVMTPILDRMALSVADAVKASTVSRKVLKTPEEVDAGDAVSRTRYSSSRSAKRSDGATLRSSTPETAESAAAELDALTQKAAAEKREIEEAKAWAAHRKALEKEAQALRQSGWDKDAQAMRNSQAEWKKLTDAQASSLKEQIRLRLEASKAAERAGVGTYNLLQKEKEIREKDNAVGQRQSIKDGANELAEARKARQSITNAWNVIERQRQQEHNAAWLAAERQKIEQEKQLWAARERARAEAQKESARALAMSVRSQVTEMEQSIAAQERLERRRNARNVKNEEAAASFGPTRSDMYRLQDSLAIQRRRAANRASRTSPVEATAPSDSDTSRVLSNKAAMTEWSRAANDAHSAARGLAGSLGMLWLTWGSTVPLVAAASLGATIRSVFVDGKNLEYQLKFVAALTEETSISFDKFADAVRGSLVTPVQAAEAMRALAQNGLDLKQSLAALPDVINLATVGEMSLADAALGATGVMAAFNLSISSLGHVGDVFAKAAAMSNTSVQSMVESMRQASTVGDQYKVTLEETSAALAVMAKRNIVGSAGGTAFRNMMTELATPTRKAQEALKQLGIELYDKDKQLKGFGTIMESLKKSLQGFNEKGRLTALEAIFDERGAKAANAILSDFTQFKEVLKDVKQGADGFTSSVTQLLQTTVQGKMRALISEFQLNTEGAFKSSRDSIASFIDSLRLVVADPGFKKFIDGLTEGTVAFFNAIREVVPNIVNVGTTLGNMVLTYGAATAASLALVAASRAVAGALALKAAAATAATGSLVGLAGAARVLASAFGWIALIGTGVSLLWEMYRASKENTTAVKNRATEEKLLSEQLNQSILQIAEKIRLTRLETEEIIAGTTSLEAREKVQRRLSEEEARGRLDSAGAEVAKAKAAWDQRRKMSDVVSHQRLRGMDDAQVLGYSRLPEAMAYKQALAVMTESQKNYNTELTRTAYLQEQRAGARKLDEFKRLGDYNRDALDRNKNLGKGEKPFYTFDKEYLSVYEANLSAEELKGLTDRLINNREKRGRDFVPPTTGGQAQANREYNADLKALLTALRLENDALKDQYDFRKKLNDLKYSPDLYGPYIKQLLDEAAADAYYTKAIDNEAQAIKRLGEVREKALKDPKRKSWSAADQTNFETEVSKRQSEKSDLERKRDQDRQISAARAGLSRSKADLDQADALSKINSGVSEYVSKMEEASRLKVTNPIDAAEEKARLDILEKNSESIRSVELQISEAQKQRNRLADDLTRATEEQRAGLQSTLDGEDEQLKVLRDQLRERKALIEAKATEAGVAARRIATDQQTPEYGMKKFLTEYTSQAESAADTIYKSMKSTTDRISDAFVELATTGKLNFKGLVNSILADLIKIQSQKMIQSLIFNIALGSGKYNMPESNVGGTWAFANGGIMTSQGPLPLRTYANGGVASSPQVAIFGEGKRPEAFVPLPDGRSIPVKMDGSDQKKTTQVSHTTNVYVDSSTDRAQVAALVRQANAEANKQLLQYLHDNGMI